MMLKKLIVPFITLCLAAHGYLLAQNDPPSRMSDRMENTQQKPSPYTAQDFSDLYGMPGFTDEMLDLHFKLYQGYVKNTNLLIDLLNNLSNQGKDRGPEYAGLKRMFGWEFDGMRLHEYYFSSLGGNGKINRDSALYRQIEKDFGSYDKWLKDYLATGAIRGIGWSILYYDTPKGRLFNVWINEHDLGHLAGEQPLLPMDVFEHAYITEYGTDRDKYMDAFVKNINWEVVENRFERTLNRNRNRSN